MIFKMYVCHDVYGKLATERCEVPIGRECHAGVQSYLELVKGLEGGFARVVSHTGQDRLTLRTSLLL
jgi:hypothetical protein